MGPEQMLSLLPNTLLAGLLYLLVKREVSRLERDKAKADVSLEKISSALIEIDKKFISTASLEQLGRMGDRFDGRVTALAQDVAVMKAVQDRK